MSDTAEELIRFVAETSTPAALSVQEVALKKSHGSTQKFHS